MSYFSSDFGSSIAILFLFYRYSHFLHILSEFVFVFFVSMNLHRTFQGLICLSMRLLFFRFLVGLRKTPATCISLLKGK